MTNKTRKIIFWVTLFLTIYNTLIFVYLLTAKAHASWEQTGNVVTPTDFIGSTNSQDVNFVRGGVPKFRVTIDGFRFLPTLVNIVDSNGQFILNHLTNGGTALYGFNGTRMVNLTTNGVEIIGNLIARTNYVVYPDGGSYTLTPTDYTVETSGCEIIVPTATGVTGKHYEIINVSSADLPIHTNNGQLIGNLNPEAQYQLPAGASVILVSNGSNWRVLK